MVINKVIFGRSYKPISLGIQIFTGCMWSHVGTLVGDNVIESVGGIGVVVTPLTEFKKRYKETLIKEIYCPKDNMINDLLNVVGTKYDHKSFYGIGLNKITKNLLKLDWDELNAYQCAEVIGKYSGIFDKNITHHLYPKHILQVSHDIK